MPADLHEIYCDACECFSEVDDDDDTCPSCGACTCAECVAARDRARDAADDDGYREPDDDDDDDDRERDPSSVPTPARATTGAAFLPVLPGRPVRPMSFEQELSRGSHRAAAALYQAGFSPWTDVHGYGSSESASREHRTRGTFVHVETDSSCDGEVIYSRLDLNDDNAAREFEAAFGIVRDLHAERSVSLNALCGFHIHVGIQGFGMRAIENLYHVHNHLEDVLYRIGSTNWRAHRSDMSGNHYAPTVQKNLRGKTSIGHWLQRSRSGLNLSNYLASRASCTCGAFTFADWERCTCDLPKATVEFRWPNATTNLRKVHAFAALLQAVVAVAANADDGEYERLPALDFTGSRTAPSIVEWETRFQWMGANLSLTRNEWESVAYCVERTTFNGHGAYLASLVRGFAPVTAELVAL